MRKDLTTVGARFDAATHYDDAAHMQKQCVALLAQKIADAFGATPPERILEFGCGTGLLTHALHDLFPHAAITATDISPQMLDRARARMAGSGVIIERMDAEQPNVRGRFDLICSSLCLQWFSDRAVGLTRLASLLAPDGRIMVTTLASGSFAEWRAACAAEAISCGFPDYPEPATLAAEWPCNGRGSWAFETLHDHPEDGLRFLRDLRQIGATAPRAGFVSSGVGLRRAVRWFDRGSRDITYEIAIGSFRRDAAPRGVFVTGTDTGVGKTLVSACLTRAWKATYWKPLQTGLAEEDGDTPTVTMLTGQPPSSILPPAYALAAPLAPWNAARAEAVTIDPARLAIPAGCEEPLVVEGAGGLMVPITDHMMMIDLIALYGLPVVLVARSGLGTINHTLLSIAALKARDIPIAGVILNGPPNPGNRHAIERFGDVAILAEVPPLDTVSPESVANQAALMPSIDEVLGAKH